MKKTFDCEDVTTIVVTLDLGDNLDKYMDRWLALCNHCRERDTILQVRNFFGSNLVEVTYLAEEDLVKDDMRAAVYHASQFGKVTEIKTETATLIYQDHWKDEKYYIYDD